MTKIVQFLHDLNSIDGRRREKAMRTLERRGDRFAIDTLVATLKNPNEDVRWRVVSALGEIGDPRAIPALLNTLKDSDHTIRRRAVASLGRIGISLEPIEVLSCERLMPDDKYRILEALGKTRYHEHGLTLKFRIGDVEQYCQKICTEQKYDSKVMQGAQEVLATRLLRPSSDKHLPNSDLLLPASFAPEPNAKENLLRQAEAPTTPQLPAKKGILARLNEFFARFRKRHQEPPQKKI